MRPAVEAPPEHGRAGLVAAVTAIAQQAEDALEKIDDDSQQLGDETLGSIRVRTWRRCSTKGTLTFSLAISSSRILICER